MSAQTSEPFMFFLSSPGAFLLPDHRSSFTQLPMTVMGFVSSVLLSGAENREAHQLSLLHSVSKHTNNKLMQYGEALEVDGFVLEVTAV